MQELHISVRNLVEFIFRAGDIDNRAGKLASAEAMMEGSRIHRKIQKSMDTSYQAEVPLKIEWKANDYVLVVEGRADGIVYGKFQPDLPAATESVLQPEMEFAAEIPPEEEISFIDEIKGVYRNVAAMEQPVYVHKAQAMCYAYIYAKQNRLERIGVQMTYCNLDTEEIRYFREIFDYETLTVWFTHLIGDYRKWADLADRMEKQRQESIHTLEFPFPTGRDKRSWLPMFTAPFCGEEPVYRGTDRCGQNNFHNLSGGKSSGRRAGRPDLLSHGKDHHSNCGKRNVRTAGRTGLSCQSDPDYSKRKTLPV